MLTKSRWIVSLLIVLMWLLSACGPAPTTASTVAPTQAAPASVPATIAPVISPTPAAIAPTTAAVLPTTVATKLPAALTPVAGTPGQLVLATTTSTQDSGLLDVLVPAFQKQFNVTLKVVAVGTGQALKLGTDGNADVVLVHARAQEDAFVKAGDGIDRRDVMYNDFIIVGPAADPAKIASVKNAADAFKKISDAQASFASRGDNSGTNTKELDIWKAAQVSPKGSWYLSVGQGMGETLTFANEKGAYTLTDRATWLAQKAKLPGLAVMVGGTRIEENADAPNLFNPYGVIPVNPAKHPGVNHELAEKFAVWITSLDTQKLIATYGVDKFGQALFRPSSDEWKKANPGN